MSGKTGEIVVDDVLGYVFPGRLAVTLTVMVRNVLDEVQANWWAVCDAKSLGLCVPLRYESVQTAFVPKTHADAGLFLLLQAAEVSREWQREIVVVQLDVKKAFDHVDHRAAFKAMRLRSVSPFSMAVIAAIWNSQHWKQRCCCRKESGSTARPREDPRQRSIEAPGTDAG